MSRITDALLPRGSRRRVAVHWFASHLLPKRAMRALGSSEEGLDESYLAWVERVEHAGFAGTAERANAIERPPLVSVVVPTYNTPEKYLRPLVRSLLEQVYEHWELCLADGSDDPAAAARIAAAAATDPRIRYRRLETNEGISGNTNRGIEMATGEFVALLDHDDALSPFGLAEVAIAADTAADADLIYSDEDKLSEDGSIRSLAFFKPDWSPDMLLSGNYLTHLTVIRRSLLEQIGGERPAYDGAQDFDLVLRASERARRIVHIPKVLYHWRLADGSTAVTVESKEYAGDAGMRAVEDAIARRGLDAEVLRLPGRHTFYRVHYRLPAERPLVSIVIPFHERDVPRLRRCVASIVRETGYRPFELVLVAADPTGTATRRYRDSTRAAAPRVRFVDSSPAADLAALTNAGRAVADGAVLVLMHPDVEVRGGDWLDELVAVAAQDGVGAVTPLLRYPGGQIQHAGVVLGLAGRTGHPWRWRDRRSFTFFGSAEWPRNFLAVSAACLCIRADRFDEAGGLAEGDRDADALLGLALHGLGLRNVYWPYVALRHDEALPEERRDRIEPLTGDRGASTRLALGGDAVDPSFNANLDPDSERIALRRTP